MHILSSSKATYRNTITKQGQLDHLKSHYYIFQNKEINVFLETRHKIQLFIRMYPIRCKNDRIFTTNCLDSYYVHSIF